MPSEPNPPDSNARGASSSAPTVTRAQFANLFMAVFVPMFMAAVDQTLLSTATPAIAASLGGFRDTSWIAVGYLLSAATIVPVYGRLGDSRGRRNMLLVALGVFALGSLCCGLAQSLPQLIAARVLQGLGGGGLMTLSQSIIGELVPPLERVRFQGYFALMFTSASLGGPVLGGFVVSHVSWRWLFFANLPIIAFAAWRLLRLPPGDKHPPKVAGTDVPGHVLFVIGALSLLYWLTSGGHRFPWISPTSGVLIVLAATMLTALFLHERRHPSPFLPVELLRKRSIRYSAMLVSLFAACLFAMVFFLPVYLQLGHRLSPQLSGLLLLPLTGGQVLSSVLAARIAKRMRDPQMIPMIGMGTTSVALLLMGLLPPHLFLVIGLGVFVGMGFGSVMAINQIVVQTVAGRARLGAATSMNSLARSTGGAAGAAFFGALVFSFIPGDRQSLLEHATSGQVDEIVQAFHWGFLAMSLVAAGAAFTASRIPRIKLWDVPAK